MKFLGKYLLGLLLFLPAFAHAAGAYLSAESAASLAFAHADGAALAEDATTNYYNPAGFVRLKCPTLSMSGTGFFIREQFTGTTTANYTFLDSTQLNGTSHASTKGFIPAFYYVMPLFEDYIWWGIGITAPIAIELRYPIGNTITRYAITNEKLTTVNFNVNIGFKLTDQLALGYGVDAVRGDIHTKNNILNPFDSDLAADWNLQTNANGYAIGFNLGLLYHPCETTRIGLSYRSKMRIYMNGNSTTNTNGVFDNIPGSPLRTSNFMMNLTLPAITYLSIYQQITPCFDVVGSVEWEQWSQFHMAQMENIPVPTVLPIDINYPLNFHNVYTLSAGARYQLTDHWSVKSGLAFIPSAVTSQNRTIVVPATAAWIAAAGAHYQFNRCLGFDFTYAHPFFQSGAINHQLAIPITGSFFPITYTTTELGIARTSGNFVGAQVNYTFD